MLSINDGKTAAFAPNYILQSDSLRLPYDHELGGRANIMQSPVPTTELRVRHHHLSYDYSRKMATEVGDLLNSNLMGVVAMANASNGVNSNFEDMSNVYSNSSNGNHSENYDYLYRHSPILTTVYCVAYFVVFAIGLVGNCLVVAVVFRAPRMRTVTNLFIVNLAIADILVVVLCIPATLLGNIFVRKYFVYLLPYLSSSTKEKKLI